MLIDSKPQGINSIQELQYRTGLEIGIVNISKLPFREKLIKVLIIKKWKPAGIFFTYPTKYLVTYINSNDIWVTKIFNESRVQEIEPDKIDRLMEIKSYEK